MKAKEGRDYVSLSSAIATIREDSIYISDTGATLQLTYADWEKLSKFVDDALAELDEDRCPRCNEQWSGTSCGIDDCGWIKGDIDE